MDLWVACHNRLHFDSDAKPWPHPPTVPSLDDLEHVFRDSHGFNLEQVSSSSGNPDLVPDPDRFVTEAEYGEAHRVQANDAIRTSGFEAIAFYAPIHIYGEAKWGIYLNERIFYGACAEAISLLGIGSWDDIIADMLLTIDRHELFHSAVELFSLVLEDFAYLGGFNDNSSCPFRIYFTNEYLKSWPSLECTEEGMATAFQLRCRFKTPGFRSIIAKMLQSAPPAYTTWRSFIHRDQLNSGVQSLAERIILGAYEVPLLAARLMANDSRNVWFPELYRSRLDSHGPVPRWLYRPDSLTPQRFNGAILANRPLRDLLSGLKHRYGAHVESGGKHQAIHFPNGNKVPYPSGRKIPRYLIRNISLALGVPAQDFLSNCLDIR